MKKDHIESTRQGPNSIEVMMEEIEKLKKSLLVEEALEKVRSRTMAMQDSDEFRETVAIFFQQLNQLSFNIQQCAITIIDSEKRESESWQSTDIEAILPSSFKIPFIDHPIFDQMIKSGLMNTSGYSVQEYAGPAKVEFDDFLFANTPLKNAPVHVAEHMRSRKKIICCRAHFAFGHLEVVSDTAAISDEKARILQRFAKVFEQTYTRFLDLQKAEAQAKEAQIEAALERVRSKSMAMHSSEQLIQVASELRNQLSKLDQEGLETCAVHLYDESPDYFFSWFALQSPDSSSEAVLTQSRFPKKGVRSIEEMMHYYYSNEKDYVIVNDEEKFNEFLLMLERYAPDIQKIVKNTAKDLKENDIKSYWSVADFKGGSLVMTTLTEPPERTRAILRRFANVFEQTYTRFLDLQKAEAQAREARIEAALERVRSRTMAMHKSEELSDCATVLFKELSDLGGSLWSTGFVILDAQEDGESIIRATDPNGQFEPAIFVNNNADPAMHRMYDAWRKGEDYFEEVLKGDALSKHYANMLALPKSGHVFQAILDAGTPFPDWQQNHAAYFAHGYLLVITIEPFTDSPLLIRFAKVFEQTYTRFLDLQKAETQAREAQIEAALERVRARSMAMHATTELPNVASILFQQLDDLHLQPRSCALGIYDEEKPHCHLYFSINGKVYPDSLEIPNNLNTNLWQVYEAWKAGKTFHAHDLQGDKLKDHNETVASFLASQGVDLPSTGENDASLRRLDYHAFFTHGMLVFAYDKPIEETQVLIRFAQVFEQTYTRFLDLQKAENQAREAQIEVALEKVRSRTMAMHKSEELAEAATVLFEQLRGLGGNLWSCGFVLCNENDPIDVQYMSIPDAGLLPPQYIPHDGEPVHQRMYKAWSSGVELHSEVAEGDHLQRLYAFLNSIPSVQQNLQKVAQAGFILPTYNKLHAARFSQGYLLIITLEDYPETEIFIRFATVFEQTYTRFLDLQTAEALAREALVETSLERVRSRTMSMRQSNELLEAAKIFSQEMVRLDIPHFMSGFVLVDEVSKKQEAWIGVPGQPEPYKFYLPLDGDGVLKTRYESWKRQDPLFYQQVRGKELASHMAYVTDHFESEQALIKSKTMPDPVVFYCGHFNQGYLHLLSETLLSDEQEKILVKFKNAFQQTYTRFLDLQKAEAQAREAQIETALEKVRSVALSMEKTADLQKVVDAVFVEMHALDIGLDHTAIVTLIDNSQDYNVWVGSADEKFTTCSRIPYNESTQVQRDYNEMIAARPTLLVKKYEGEIKREYSQYLFSQTEFKDNTPEKELRLMKDGASFTTSIFMLEHTGIQIISYAAEVFSDQDHDMLERFATVFEQAYIRFMDIQKSEMQAKKILEERNRLEHALSELKATQAQLIQSEKMASLGELTAGIAHEIQNPLNFVNNFSDVSSELLDEVKEELKKGELDEVQDIVESLKENLSKINHHGRRASSIVKGMLDHSRISAGEKEKTDINKLCDEYLRLAYHGMRAKNKSFNVNYATDFQQDLPKINAIPQDIGRVILNLVNNAFQACQTMSEIETDEYKPLVKVSTRHFPTAEGGRGEERILISVSDNGPGIPEEIKDKIFQPFFTTKPTGQGTGLGLSLSYDIVKAHGGELRVHSEKGSSSVFTITLPIVQN